MFLNPNAIKGFVLCSITVVLISSCTDKKVYLTTDQEKLIKKADEKIAFKKASSGDTLKYLVTKKRSNSYESYPGHREKYEIAELDYKNSNSIVGLNMEARKERDEAIIGFSFRGVGFDTKWGYYGLENGMTINGRTFDNVRTYHTTDSPLKIWLKLSHGMIKVKNKESGEVYERIDI